MTTIKSLRRQFFNCCVFWGKEYQQNCSCCVHHLPPISPFHSNCLDWSKVQSCMPYIQPMHGHATPFFTPIFPSGFQSVKQKRPPRCITSYPLMSHGYYSRVICYRSHEQAKNQPKLDQEQKSMGSGAETCELHLTGRTINCTTPSLSLFHSHCSCPTVQAFLKLG